MDVESTDLGNAQQREVNRRLALLGDLIYKEYDYQLLREQAHRTLVPVHILWSW